MNFKSEIKLLKKSLEIDKVLSVRFSDSKDSSYGQFSDTICTSLARSFLNNKKIFIDRKIGQLCPGGNYFLKVNEEKIKDVCSVYVKDEKVFKKNNICLDFLQQSTTLPKKYQKRYVLVSPLFLEKTKPEVIILQVNSAQAGRLLGLSVFNKMQFPKVIPAASTCISIYQPLISDQIHLNFIDYYDRYYQGKVGGKLVWNDNSMLISMKYNVFSDILKVVPLSPHGLFKPNNLLPKKVTKFS